MEGCMHMNKQLTICSLFSGIGGIDLGFVQAGFAVAWANEIDKYAANTYKTNLNESTLVVGDIKKIDVSKIPDFDVLVAGFPCQSFSTAGKQKGFDDARGNLFFQIVEVAQLIRPRIIFLENVANLIDHDDGKTFITMFNSLSGLNYVLCYRNMPSNEYGNTPQTRNRTYVVAFREDALCDRFKYPEPIELTTGIFDIIKRDVKQKEVYYYKEEDRFWKYMLDNVKRKDSIYRVHDSGIHLAKNQTCPTLTASMGTRDDMVPIVIDDFGYRRLTVRECLDFQGFPKDFSFPTGTTMKEAYKQIGNSVCVTVIRRIAEQIYKVVEEYDATK